MTNEDIFREALSKIAATKSAPVGSECVLIAEMALAFGALSDSQSETPAGTQRDWVIDRIMEINRALLVAIENDTNGDHAVDEIKEAQELLLRVMASL